MLNEQQQNSYELLPVLDHRCLYCKCTSGHIFSLTVIKIFQGTISLFIIAYFCLKFALYLYSSGHCCEIVIVGVTFFL